MKILLLGSTGQLGHALFKPLSALGSLTTLTRQELDLSIATQDSIAAYLEEHQADWVVNASAYTAVDQAETEVDLAYQINSKIPEYLAKTCSAMGSALVHYSTDFVFDGHTQIPYVETDAVAPLSVYGQSKLQGELAIQSNCLQHLIFRTAWVMGTHGGNFLKTILRLAQTREELQVIDDQWGAPTPAEWLAEVTAKAIAVCEQAKSHPKGLKNPPWGLYHATGEGRISWHQYAQAIVQEANAIGFELKLNWENVRAISHSDYVQAAQRPLFSVLNCQKLLQTFSVTQPDWRLSVHNVLTKLQSNHR